VRIAASGLCGRRLHVLGILRTSGVSAAKADLEVGVPAGLVPIMRASFRTQRMALGSFSNKHGLNGFEHDKRIEDARHVLDIKEVILQFLYGVF